MSTTTRTTTCPTWCAGPEAHQVVTWADDTGMHARRHARRMGSWLLADYTVTGRAGESMPEPARIEWAPTGPVGSPEAERDNLARLLELNPNADTPTLQHVELAGADLGVDTSTWVCLLDDVVFEHPRTVEALDCPAWCDQHGREHKVARDVVGSIPPMRHEWRRDCGHGASVRLQRFDWPDEAPQLEVVVEDGDGLTIETAREVSEAIAQAADLAEGIEDADDGVTLSEVERVATVMSLRVSELFALSESKRSMAPVRVVLELDPSVDVVDRVSIERDGGLSMQQVARLAIDALETI